jgi:hypothetical protein
VIWGKRNARLVAGFGRFQDTAKARRLATEKILLKNFAYGKHTHFPRLH